MTTIACTLKAMAGDTRVTWSDKGNDRVVAAYGTKVERIGDEILGTSGDYAAGVRYHDWVRAGRPKRPPKLDKEFRALILSKSGILLIDGLDPTPMPVGPNFYAVGSGSPYALGALERGATLEEAIEIAKKYDVYTGGDITVLEL